MFFNGDGRPEDGVARLGKEEIVDISIYQYTNTYTKSTSILITIPKVLCVNCELVYYHYSRIITVSHLHYL